MSDINRAKPHNNVGESHMLYEKVIVSISMKNIDNIQGVLRWSLLNILLVFENLQVHFVDLSFFRCLRYIELLK